MSDSPKPKRNTSQKGAWGEALATAWLIERGYEVYAGLGNPSCDFVTYKDGVFRRVEVKAASKRTTGAKGYHLGGVRREKFDELLVVLPDGSVLDSIDPERTSPCGGLWIPEYLTLNGEADA